MVEKAFKKKWSKRWIYVDFSFEITKLLKGEKHLTSGTNGKNRKSGQREKIDKLEDIPVRTRKLIKSYFWVSYFE